MTHAELALQATLLVYCLGVLAGGALSYAVDVALWLRRRMAERRQRQAQARARYGGILS